VIVATHVCPQASIRPHHPVPFMVSPIDQETMNRHEVDPAMDALLCVDTTRGNRILNRRGLAITPTVKEGYILRVSEDLLDVLEAVTGRPPAVLAITHQDITPYANGLFHLNSILQPSTATPAPAVGVALTAEAVATTFGAGECRFYDQAEFARLVARYGSLAHLQTPGREPEEGG